MRVFVTGFEKGIGKELVGRGYQPLLCDVLNLDDVNQKIQEAKPDVIIHTDGISDVEYCEKHDKEAFAANVRSVNNLIYDFHGTLIYLSSVHVFDGERQWDYTEKNRPNPINVYGFTKWAGEQIASFRGGKERTIVIRTSQSFDDEMVLSIVARLKNGESIEFPRMVTRSFLYRPHFAEGIMWLVDNLDKYPELEVLNIAGTETLNYYKFWMMASDIFGINKKFINYKDWTEDKLLPAKGGLNISNAKKMGIPLYSAKQGLKEIKNNHA